MNRILRAGSIVLLLAMGAIVTGCSHGTDAANAPVNSQNTAVTSPPGAAMGKKSAGATPDVDVYAAPSGVKTGTEGGGKK